MKHWRPGASDAAVPDWWPEWQGEPVAIIASGPSTRGADLDALRGRVRVIAIKENADLCPWADSVYGCDAPWWKHRGGLPEFAGLKLAWDERLPSAFPGIRRVRVEKLTDRLLLDEPALVGAGGNSGFQALNLAVQFGARRIILIGFDMHGTHWYGDNRWPRANNPEESHFKRWRAAFVTAAGQTAALGIDVINASPSSTLKCFPKQTLAETLAAWSR